MCQNRRVFCILLKLFNVLGTACLHSVIPYRQQHHLDHHCLGYHLVQRDHYHQHQSNLPHLFFPKITNNIQNTIQKLISQLVYCEFCYQLLALTEPHYTLVVIRVSTNQRTGNSFFSIFKNLLNHKSLDNTTDYYYLFKINSQNNVQLLSANPGVLRRLH